MRIGIFVVATLATVMGITIKTVYGLWFLCSDLVYVVLFPQLLCVVYLKSSNTYGSWSGFWVGTIMRLLSGEALFHLPSVIKYPFFDEENNYQRFPFRTFNMLLSMALIVGVSHLTKFLFEKGHLSKKWDIFQCVTNIPPEAMVLKESVTVDEFSKLNVNSNNKYSENSANE
jgi:solute carrier family 5 (high affinity choline transporter), member 7